MITTFLFLGSITWKSILFLFAYLIADSLSGKNNSANNLNPIKLDFSYRPVSKIPLNVYVGAGVELKRGKGYFTPFGISYAINNFVLFAELSTYQGLSTEEQHIESGYWTTESVYVEDGYWEEYYVDYYYGGYWESYWVNTSYWDEQSVFNDTSHSNEGEVWQSKSSIFFGIRWYLK